MNKSRLEAFSDGVFAIIITIMVLDLKVPHGGTPQDLMPILPVFLSYVQSFLFVSNYWLNHHHLLHTAKHTNWAIMLANLFLLFCLSLVPFITAWAGETDFASFPVAIYALVLLMSGIAYTLLQYSIQKSSVWTPEIKKAIKQMSYKGIVSTVLYIASFFIAFYNPRISEIIFLCISILWFIPFKGIEKAFDENQSKH